MASTTGSDDVNATVSDIYDMMIAELNESSLVCPAVDDYPLFYPLAYLGVQDGLNNQS